MHVVLIEDDEKIGSFVSRGLKQEGHVVSWARTGDEASSSRATPEPTSRSWT
jgi:DNA-binding response OmpR family regulator